MRWLDRCAALAVLVVVLACSGLGVCWRQFARSGDDCCQQDETASVTTTHPCSSAASHVSATKVLPPVAVAAVPYPAPRAIARAIVVLTAISLPEKAPPLVLRI